MTPGDSRGARGSDPIHFPLCRPRESKLKGGRRQGRASRWGRAWAGGARPRLERLQPPGPAAEIPALQPQEQTNSKPANKGTAQREGSPMGEVGE